MAIDCWSVSAEVVGRSDRLPRVKNGYVQVARLNKLPPTLLLTGKAVFQNASDQSPSDHFFVVEALLCFGTSIVDRAYCNVSMRYPSATSVSLHGTVDAVSRSTGLVKKSGSRRHSAYLRVFSYGPPVLIGNVWLIAAELSSLVHSGPIPQKI